MTPHSTAAPHVGICVSDLDRSVRFWCEGLGFEPAERFELDDTALAVDPTKADLGVQLVFLADPDGTRVELLQR